MGWRPSTKSDKNSKRQSAFTKNRSLFSKRFSARNTSQRRWLRGIWHAFYEFKERPPRLLSWTIMLRTSFHVVQREAQRPRLLAALPAFLNCSETRTRDQKRV